MKTIYWPWLHVLAIHVAAGLVVSVFLMADPSRRSPEAIAFVRTHAHLLIWASLLVGLMFSAYGRPYRWFWLAWLCLVLIPMLATYAIHLVPMGQMIFWPASKLAPLVPTEIEATANGAVLVSATSTLLSILGSITALMLVLLMIRQLWLAGRQRQQDPDQHARPVFIGRYTMIGSIGLVLYVTIAVVGTLILFDDLMQVPIESQKHQGGLLSGNPLVTPAHIVPEWYFLPFYSALRSIPDKALGLAAATGLFAALLLLPWLDRNPLQPVWRRPYYGPCLIVLFMAIGGLFYLGALSADRFTIVWTRVCVATYFATILVVLPVVSRYEAKSASSGHTRSPD